MIVSSAIDDQLAVWNERASERASEGGGNFTAMSVWVVWALGAPWLLGAGGWAELMNGRSYLGGETNPLSFTVDVGFK